MKKVNGIVAAVAFAAVAGVNVYNAQVTETAMCDLQMENIEAGASCSLSEGGQWCLSAKGTRMSVTKNILTNSQYAAQERG